MNQQHTAPAADLAAEPAGGPLAASTDSGTTDTGATLPVDADLLQLLTPTGVRVETPENAAYRERVAHLDADALRGLYRDMVLTRRFDDESTSLQRQGELGLFPRRSARRPRRSARVARSPRRTTSSRPTVSTGSRTRAASTSRTSCASSAASTTAAGTRTSTTSTSTRS